MCAKTRRLKKSVTGDLDQAGPEVLRKGNVPYVHLDAESGTMDYLACAAAEGFELECRRCGTIIQFLAGKCPICGANFSLGSSGLAELLEGLSFEDEQSPEEICPACGEVVVLETGSCPACGEEVRSGENKVLPVEVGDNVVFMHLDVMTGEISCLRRSAADAGFEHASLRLDGRIRVGHGLDKEGASEA